MIFFTKQRLCIKIYFYDNIQALNFYDYENQKNYSNKSLFSSFSFPTDMLVHWLWIGRIEIECEFHQYFLNIPKRHLVPYIDRDTGAHRPDPGDTWVR